jgi:hypothetical protein
MGRVTTVADDRIGIIGGGVADAPKPASTGSDVGFQDGADPVSRRQVGEADDTGG